MADELLFQPVKRGTKAQWDAEDNKSSGYRLPARALGLDITNNLLKVGDGISKFNELPNLNAEEAVREKYILPKKNTFSYRDQKITNVFHEGFFTVSNPGKIRIKLPASVSDVLGYLSIKLLIYFYDGGSSPRSCPTEILIAGFPKSGASVTSEITENFSPWNRIGCNITNTGTIKKCEIGIYDDNGSYDDNGNFIIDKTSAKWCLLFSSDTGIIPRTSVLIEEVIGEEILCNPDDFEIDICSVSSNGEDSKFWLSKQNVNINYLFSAYNIIINHDLSISNNLTTKNLTASNNGQIGTIQIGTFTDPNGDTLGTGTNLGKNSLSVGELNGTTSSNTGKILLGRLNFSKSINQYLIGYGLIGSSPAQTILGQFNSENSIDQYNFIVGNGSQGNRRNAIRITDNNELYSSAAWNTSGADYAEYFEWEDENPNNEDRVGLFVANSNGKIKIANSNDFILGVISANPSCVGGNPEEWDDRFLKDIYGRVITEDEIIEDSYQEVEIETGEFDEEGNPVIEIQQILIKEHTYKKPIENPEYDKEQKYIARNRRKEWAPVGLIGQLVVRDDGTCQPDSFCTCGDNGVATSTLNSTRFRVLKRLDDSHVKILIL